MASHNKNLLYLFFFSLITLWMPLKAAQRGLSPYIPIPDKKYFFIQYIIKYKEYKTEAKKRAKGSKQHQYKLKQEEIFYNEIKGIIKKHTFDGSIPFVYKYGEHSIEIFKFRGYKLMQFVVSEGDEKILDLFLADPHYDQFLEERIDDKTNKTKLATFNPFQLAIYMGKEKMVDLFLALVVLRRTTHKVAHIWSQEAKTCEDVSSIVLRYIGDEIKFQDARVILSGGIYEEYHAIHIAAEKDLHQIARKLLIYNPAFAFLQAKGDYPLHLAAMSGNKKTVDVFIELAPSCITIVGNVENTGTKGLDPFLSGVSSGSHEVVEQFLEYDLKHNNIFKLLTKKVGAGSFFRGWTNLNAFEIAAEMGWHKMLRVLFKYDKEKIFKEKGLSKRYQGLNILEIAILNEKLEAVQEILRCGPSLLSEKVKDEESVWDGYTPIFMAVLKNSSSEILRELLKYDKDKALVKKIFRVKDYSEYNGYTALHMAIQSKKLTFIPILLEHDPSLFDTVVENSESIYDELNVIEMAEKIGNKNIIDYLKTYLASKNKAAQTFS